MSTLVQIIKEHISYKNQIFKLAKADLVKTYRGAALGWMWAIIKPAVTIFVYWFAFTIGLRAGKSVNGFPYFLWIIAGVVPWFYISEMITGGTECIRKYSYLVTKMKFPVATIPTFINISKFSIHVLLIAIVIIIFMVLGYMPDIYLLQLPVYMLLAFLFLNFWGLFSSLLGVISKDYSNLVPKLLHINPVTFLVRVFRNCIIYKIWFWEQPKRLIYFLIITAILLILAIATYKKLRKDIPDVL